MWGARDPRRRDRPGAGPAGRDRRPSSRARCGTRRGQAHRQPARHAARRRRARLAEPLPHPHDCPLAHPRRIRPPRARRAAGLTASPRRARRGAGLPDRLRAALGPGRARGSPDASRAARRVRPGAPLRRAAAALRPPRPGAQPGFRGTGPAARDQDRRDRRRARPLARPRRAAGRVRGAPSPPHARRLRAAATRQSQPRDDLAAGDGEPFRRPPRGRRRDAEAGRAAALRPHQRPRLPLPRRGGAGRPQATRGAVRGAPAGALWRRRAGPRAGRARRGGGAARRRAEGDRPARAGRLLPAAPRDARALARGRDRGARAGLGAGAARARPRPGLLGLLARLLSDGPLAHRSGRERAGAGPLPARGAPRAARHRPRLPPRHPRAADPARARSLRPRPRGAGRRLPDVPRARRGARAGQGARPAARRDRADRPRRRPLESGGRRGGLRRGAGLHVPPPRRRLLRPPLGALALAGPARRGGAGPAPATSRSTRAA